MGLTTYAGFESSPLWGTDWDKALREISRVLGPTGLYPLNNLSLPKFTARIYEACGVFSADDVINHLGAGKLGR